MARMSYMELVELLGKKVTGKAKERLDYVVERKRALKEEDSDLDGVLDDLLREIRGESK